MSSSSILLIIGTFAALASPSSAGGFLGQMNVNTDELEASLLKELSGSVTLAGERIQAFEVALKPMVESVPKEASGAMTHAVVRYVLHRFFAQKRGWYIRGLEPAGDARNASLPALKDLQEWVPSYLQAFLEQLMGGRGLSLRELAVFAETLEDLIHKEAVRWLQGAYAALNVSEDKILDDEQVMEVISTYMMIYMLEGNFTAETPEKVYHLQDLFALKVKNWRETLQWARDLVKELYPTAHRFDFNSTASVIKLAGERYGTFNDQECARLKAALMDIESRKPGRVRLTDFYKKSLYGPWEFNEKVEYLRALGALDESDPTTPLVIMPNYVASRPNCLVTSNFYAVCCRNECEGLMQSLEKQFPGPMADPEKILELVPTLSSDTVAAPRNLSKVVKERLKNVAMIHDGKVPLHGRLFAQWMHHAYPRECPFPHEAGMANPMTPDEWMEGTGETRSKASEEEMMKHVDSDTCKFLPRGMVCGSGNSKHPVALLHKSSDSSAEDEDLPWKDVEELLVTHESLPNPAATHRLPMLPDGLPPFYRFVFFAALTPAAFAVSWYAKAPKKDKGAKGCSDASWA